MVTQRILPDEIWKSGDVNYKQVKISISNDTISIRTYAKFSGYKDPGTSDDVRDIFTDGLPIGTIWGGPSGDISAEMIMWINGQQLPPRSDHTFDNYDFTYDNESASFTPGQEFVWRVGTWNNFAVAREFTVFVEVTTP